MVEREKYSKNKKLIGPGPILVFGFIILLIIAGLLYYFLYMKPLDKQGFSCVDSTECEDNNLCTIDECSPRTGICYHSEKICSSGEYCNSDTGECELIEELEDIEDTEDYTGEEESTEQETDQTSQEETPVEEELIPQTSTDQIEYAIRGALNL